MTAIATPHQILARAKTRALLVTNLVNIRYLTGLTLSAGYILVTPKLITLYADDRYREAARAWVGKKIALKHADQIGRDIASLRSCGIDAEHMTLASYRRLEKKFPRVRLRPTSDVIEYFRRSKSETELRSVRKACAMTRKILRKIPALLKTGITESELSWRLRVMAHDLGAEGMAFDTIVAFGVNTSSPHHHPGQKKFRRGDLVQIDMGVVVGGYCSDFSRVYFTGPKTVEQGSAYLALLKAKKSAESLIRSGVGTRQLDRTARKVLKHFGYDKEFCHALGHGVGLEIHEGVVLSSKAPDTVLLENEVITVEPGLYFPGKWGMRVEDTVIVRK